MLAAAAAAAESASFVEAEVGDAEEWAGVAVAAAACLKKLKHQREGLALPADFQSQTLHLKK